MVDGSSIEVGEVDILPEYENYVLSAGELVKTGKYEEAIRQLRNGDVAKRFGLTFAKDSKTLIISKEISDKKIDEYSHTLAALSWFKIESKRIEIAGVVAMPNLHIEVPQRLLQESALIHMEEWLHGLQYLKGSNLTNEIDHEVDIAVYMAEKGIPLTNNFLNRHNRAEAVKTQGNVA